MILRCPKELAPVTGLDDPTVASWHVGDDANRTRLDFSQVAERPHLVETATGRNGSHCKALHTATPMHGCVLRIGVEVGRCLHTLKADRTLSVRFNPDEDRSTATNQSSGRPRRGRCRARGRLCGRLGWTPTFVAYANLARTPSISVREKARIVCVRTLPPAPIANPSAVIDASSGASIIAITS